MSWINQNYKKQANIMAELLPKIHYAFIIDGETVGITVTDSPIRKIKENLNLKVYYDAKTPVFILNFPLRECRNSMSTYMALDEGCIESYTYLFVNDEQLLVIHERNKFLNPLEGFWNNVLSYEDMTPSNITVVHKVLSHHYSEPIVLVLRFFVDKDSIPTFFRIQ
eukprot:NODE_4_length_55019_cov_0.425091.p34 type:complete len:166 gc:universal NODE_4_length_55019_cov_0.425091:32144-31647(-)